MTTTPSPSLFTGVPDDATLSRAADQLLQTLKTAAGPLPLAPGDDMVHIPDTADQAYWAYEQLRNAVEYQEQHLLMRNAIGRFLNRHFSDAANGKTTIGYELVRELTKARYLANNSVLESVINEVDEHIAGYQKLHHHTLPFIKRDKAGVLRRIIGIASADIQNLLLPNPQQTALINFTFHSLYAHLETPQPLSEIEAAALYAAVHRALLKSDEATISFSMFNNQFMQWQTTEQHIMAAGQRLPEFFVFLEDVLYGDAAYRMNRLARNNIAPYIVLHSTLQELKDPASLLEQPAKLLSKAAEVTEVQYGKAKKRLRSSVVRAIIFLFITKMVIGLILEIPYDIYVNGHIDWLPLAINLIFPPLYMLGIGLTIKTPDYKNTDKILHDLRAALYQQGKLHYVLPRARREQVSFGFNLIYTIITLAVLGGLAYGLYLVHFTIASGLIFFLFLSTVSFFGYRISQAVRELQLVDKRTALDVLGSIIFTPFIRLGQWLSSRYSKVNIFIIILDFIIEAPLKTLLRLYEQWLAFLRDKQDDVL